MNLDMEKDSSLRFGMTTNIGQLVISNGVRDLSLNGTTIKRHYRCEDGPASA
jgi:hypothetical protein